MNREIDRVASHPLLDPSVHWSHSTVLGFDVQGRPRGGRRIAVTVNERTFAENRREDRIVAEIESELTASFGCGIRE